MKTPRFPSAAVAHRSFGPYLARTLRGVGWRVAAAAVLIGSAHAAETLRLSSGEILIGRTIERTAGMIVFESETLGRLRVPAASVQSENGPAPAPVGGPAPSSQPPVVAADPAPAPSGSWVRRKLSLPAAFTGSVEFGADVLSAEADMRNYHFEAGFGWKDEKNEYATYHLYDYVSVDGVQAAKTHDEGARWIRHLNSRWMLLGQADWRSDESQQLDYRVDTVAVPAFYVWKQKRSALLAGVGPAHEWRRWLVPGAATVSHWNVAAYEVLRFGLTPTLSLRQTFLAYVDPQDRDDYRYVFDVVLRQQLTAGVSLILNYNRREESRPAPGIVREQDRLMTKLGYEF